MGKTHTYKNIIFTLSKLRVSCWIPEDTLALSKLKLFLLSQIEVGIVPFNLRLISSKSNHQPTTLNQDILLLGLKISSNNSSSNFIALKLYVHIIGISSFSPWYFQNLLTTHLCIQREMLTNALRVIINNLFKGSFYGRKKKNN